SRRRKPCRPAPREQRTEQQHGSAQPSDERRVGTIVRDARALDPERGGAAPLDPPAQRRDDVEQHGPRAGPPHVRHLPPVGREQGGREGGGGPVLGPPPRRPAPTALARRSPSSWPSVLRHAPPRNSPRYTISSLSSTPNVARTASRQRSIRRRISAALAPP